LPQHNWEVLRIRIEDRDLPSGKHTKKYGKSPFLMGKLTISMAIFHWNVANPPEVEKNICGIFPKCWRARRPPSTATRGWVNTYGFAPYALAELCT
jgi:hypothetical protein